LGKKYLYNGFETFYMNQYKLPKNQRSSIGLPDWRVLLLTDSDED